MLLNVETIEGSLSCHALIRYSHEYYFSWIPSSFLRTREIGKYQVDFMRGKGPIDQIFSLRMILEKTREYNIQTHHLFIDFGAVYGSVSREELFRAMLEMDVLNKLVQLICLSMESVQFFVGAVRCFHQLQGLKAGTWASLPIIQFYIRRCH